ncbi:MAG TPA: CPBP family glutamic-type intramembrane protease, partial [Nitrososphaerales archaeon]|nr:CPBP family glutamic-type intramembrane protease [Nitrososphaerales archaeon]
LKSVYVAIIVSAVLFGLAHVLLGAGWGPGKILSAAIAGIGLAGLYYVYGLPAAILLHWSIDYFLSVFDLNSSLSSAGDWITLYTLFLAVVGSVVLILLVVRSFRNRTLGLSPNTWFGGS